MKQSDARRTPILRRVIEGPIYRFSGWLTVISTIAALIIMVLVTADVLMRRFLNMPIKGSYEVSSALLAVLVSCCIAWVMTQKGHIVVDLFTRKYPQRLREVIRGIALLFSLIIVGLISWGCVVFALQEFRIGTKSILIGIPSAPFISVLAFGCAILFLVILVQSINTFVRSKED